MCIKNLFFVSFLSLGCGDKNNSKPNRSDTPKSTNPYITKENNGKLFAPTSPTSSKPSTVSQADSQRPIDNKSEIIPKTKDIYQSFTILNTLSIYNYSNVKNDNAVTHFKIFIEKSNDMLTLTLCEKQQDIFDIFSGTRHQILNLSGCPSGFQKVEDLGYVSPNQSDNLVPFYSCTSDNYLAISNHEGVCPKDYSKNNILFFAKTP